VLRFAIATKCTSMSLTVKTLRGGRQLLDWLRFQLRSPEWKVDSARVPEGGRRTERLSPRYRRPQFGRLKVLDFAATCGAWREFKYGTTDALQQAAQSTDDQTTREGERILRRLGLLAKSSPGLKEWTHRILFELHYNIGQRRHCRRAAPSSAARRGRGSRDGDSRAAVAPTARRRRGIRARSRRRRG
jgi:hypothetical protein